MRIQQMRNIGRQIITNWQLCYQVRIVMVTWHNAAPSYLFRGWKLLRRTIWGNGPFNQKKTYFGYLPKLSLLPSVNIGTDPRLWSRNNPQWCILWNKHPNMNQWKIAFCSYHAGTLRAFPCSQSDHQVRMVLLLFPYRISSGGLLYFFLSSFWLCRLTVIRRCNKSMSESNSRLQSEQEVCPPPHRLCLHLHQGSGKRGHVWPSQMPQGAQEFLWESPRGFHQKDIVLSMSGWTLRRTTPENYCSWVFLPLQHQTKLPLASGLLLRRPYLQVGPAAVNIREENSIDTDSLIFLPTDPDWLTSNKTVNLQTYLQMAALSTTMLHACRLTWGWLVSDTTAAYRVDTLRPQTCRHMLMLWRIILLSCRRQHSA